MFIVNVFIGFCCGIIIGFIGGILYIKAKQIDEKYSFDYPSDIPEGIAPPKKKQMPKASDPS